MKHFNVYVMAAVLLLSLQCFAQKNNGFTIKGQFKGLPDGTKVYLTTQELDTVARTISKGDKFIFIGKLLLDCRAHFIWLDTLVSTTATKPIFVVNGEMAVKGVVGDRDIIVTGSPAHQEYNDMLQINETYKKKQAENRGSANTLIEEGNQMKQKWIAAHPASLCSPYFIKNWNLDYSLDDRQKAYNELTSVAKLSYYGVQLKNQLEIDRLTKIIKEGSKIPNFSVSTPAGKEEFVYNIAAKSKYTLIDCWASWCSPCRNEIPKLKEIYDAFRDKGFNILGVSIDQKEQDWRMALKQDGTEWDHGLDNKDNRVNQLFGLQAIPAYILIDHEGKIIAFDCVKARIPAFGGSLRGVDLKKKIELLFNK